MSFVVKILLLNLLSLSPQAIIITAQISFNSKKQICCNGTVSDRGNSTTMTCFGFRAYDERKFMKCYKDELLEIPSGDNYNMFLCCTDFAMETSTLYKPATQMCFMGNVSEKPTPKGIYSKCNGQIYNLETHNCCGKKLLDLRYEECCGNTPFSIISQACCGTGFEMKIHKRPSNYLLMYSCCGIDLIDKRKDFCCSGVVKSRTTLDMGDLSNVDCCGSAPFDPRTQTCCFTTPKYNVTGKYFFRVAKIANLTKGMSLACCGSSLYDYNTQICCYRDETVISKSASYENRRQMECCGGQAFNNTIQQCFKNKIYARDGILLRSCGVKVYNILTHLCCNDRVYDKDKNLTCCFETSKLYDPRTHKCCLGAIVPLTDEDREAGNDDCCSPGNNGNSFIMRKSLYR